MHCIIMTQFTFHRLQELKIVTQLGSSFGIVHKGEWNQSDDATTPSRNHVVTLFVWWLRLASRGNDGTGYK